SACRVPARTGDQGAGVVDADGQLAGVDHLDVGVGAGQCGVAGLAVAAAAVHRPEPGGPVNSQAWVMPPGCLPASPRRMPAAAAAAARRTATVGSWPT